MTSEQSETDLTSRVISMAPLSSNCGVPIQEIKAKSGFDGSDQALHLAVSLGSMLLANGAEINRVEDSMRRVLVAYGVIEPEVFAISSCIVVTVTKEDRQAATRLKRIMTRATNLERFTRLNALSRRLVKERPPYEEGIEALNEILRTPIYPQWANAIAYFFVAGMFTLLYGGTFWDGLFSGVCSFLAWILVYIATRLHVHPFLRNVVVSGLSAFLAGVAKSYYPWVNMDLIIIGTFMPQVPGVLMTNGVRDILSGDFIAGILSLVEAGMIAIAMAIGAAFGLALLRFI